MLVLLKKNKLIFDTKNYLTSGLHFMNIQKLNFLNIDIFECFVKKMITYFILHKLNIFNLRRTNFHQPWTTL